jgi:molybdate transport system substrate-binding protein
MPGAEFYVDRAIERGLADGSTKRVVGYFVPVLFVAGGNPKSVRTLADLQQPGLRVGLGDERSCAVGRATLEILKKNSIAYSAVEPNVVYKSGTVEELVEAVGLGSVDVAVVWDANARLYAAHGETVPIPAEQNVISAIPIVMLNSSRHAEESRRFIEFACSAQARRILDKLGYTTTWQGVEGAASDKEETDR